VIGGGGFSEAALVLRILVFALAFIFFGNFFNSVLIAGNLQKRLMLVLGFAAVTNIGLNLVLIPRFSYYGAAGVSVLTEFIVVAITFYLSAKKIKYIPKLEKIGSILISAGMMAIFLFVFKKDNFIFLAVSSSFIYFVFLWLFRVVKTEEIKSLISKKGVQEYGETA
jgi:O-antigen/teichoic acid export membrane protein